MAARIMMTFVLGASLMITACSSTSPMGPEQESEINGQQEFPDKNTQLVNEGNPKAKLDEDRWMVEQRSVDLSAELEQPGEAKVGRSRLYRKGFLLTDTPDPQAPGDGKICGGTLAGAIARDRYKRGGELGTDSESPDFELAPEGVHKDEPLGPVELPSVIIHPNPGTEESKGTDN